MMDWSSPLEEEEIDWATPLPSSNKQQTKGWTGIGQDFVSLIKNSPELLENLSNNVLEGTPKQLAGVAQNPGRIPQGLLAGLLGGPHFVASLPPMLGNYLAKKDIISQKTASRIPKPPFSPQELVGFKEEKPGDVLTGLLGGFASGGPIGPSAIKGGAKGVKNAAREGVENLSKGQFGQAYRGISNTRTGEVLKEGYKKDLAKSTEMYGDVGRSAKTAGVENIPHNISQKEIDLIKDILPEDYVINLEKAIQNPTFDNFHEAQSELLKFSRLVKRRAKTNLELANPVKQAGKKAKELSERIQQAMAKELMNKGGLDLLFKYIGAGEHYADNVVPWWKLPSIEGATKIPGQEGYRYPYHLPKEAGFKKANSFLSGKGQEFPELIINRKLASPYARLMEALSGMGMYTGVLKD